MLNDNRHHFLIRCQFFQISDQSAYTTHLAVGVKHHGPFYQAVVHLSPTCESCDSAHVSLTCYVSIHVAVAYHISFRTLVSHDTADLLSAINSSGEGAGGKGSAGSRFSHDAAYFRFQKVKISISYRGSLNACKEVSFTYDTAEQVRRSAHHGMVDMDISQRSCGVGARRIAHYGISHDARLIGFIEYHCRTVYHEVGNLRIGIHVVEQTAVGEQ